MLLAVYYTISQLNMSDHGKSEIPAQLLTTSNYPLTTNSKRRFDERIVDAALGGVVVYAHVEDRRIAETARTRDEELLICIRCKFVQ